MMISPNKMIFETKYSDNSGVEFAVRCDIDDYEHEIEIEHIDKINIPKEKLSWLIKCLEQIRSEYGWYEKENKAQQGT